MNKLLDIQFFLPRNTKQHLILLLVRIIFEESIRAVIMKNILRLKK